jgi:RNA polymerase sigma-70 factor
MRFEALSRPRKATFAAWMGRGMAELTYENFFARERGRIEELYLASDARQWSVPLEDFARAAWQGIAAAAQDDPSRIPQLLAALRVKDLALALGCARGNEPAWDTFCAEYRPALYDSARALTHDETQARELADSLFADLYGLETAERGRPSRFAYFHGRSSLKTWLRAVLYQKFVDEYRRQSRLEPLPENLEEPAAAGSSVSAEDDRRYAECLGEAVEAALVELPPQEKLLLSYYYAQEMTLKQVGRLTGEHEATISRHLETLRKKLRRRIETHLRQVTKLSAFEVDRCLDFASRGVMLKLEKALKVE